MPEPTNPSFPPENATDEPETPVLGPHADTRLRDEKGRLLPGQMPLYHTGKAGKKPGRPKGRNLDRLLAEICDEPVGEKFMSRGEALARLLADVPNMTEAGWTARMKAIELIFDRMEGKPKQRVETSEAPNLELVIDEQTDESEAADETEGDGGNG
jgi:hypothetical protein